MSEAMLKAYNRVEKPKALRRIGMIPGALCGKDYEKSIPVQFEEQAVKKLISVHGPRAKVFVEFDGKKHFGVVDEVQKVALTGAFVHIHIRMLGQNDEIKIQLPITYVGLAELEHNNLMLTVHMHKLEVTGKASKIPEHIVVNVAESKLGDVFRTSDLNLEKHIKVHEDLDTILATVQEKKIIVEEEVVAEAEPVEGEEAPIATAATGATK